MKTSFSILFILLFFFAVSVDTLMFCFEVSPGVSISVIENFSGEEKESDTEESKGKNEEPLISEGNDHLDSNDLGALPLTFAHHAWCAARSGHNECVYSPPEVF
ncbi:MAG: hypothetical protein ACKVOR_09670 [Flavobacteriales bacterium]